MTHEVANTYSEENLFARAFGYRPYYEATIRRIIANPIEQFAVITILGERRLWGFGPRQRYTTIARQFNRYMILLDDEFITIACPIEGSTLYTLLTLDEFIAHELAGLQHGTKAVYAAINGAGSLLAQLAPAR